MHQALRFAHFEVLTRSDGSPHILGQGAMGVTYKALDQNLLSMAVVKVPAVEQLKHPAARQRFLQEAQMMARLRHPHVANVFFYGDSPAGAFYAMEFCDGPSLHDYVRDHGPLNYLDTLQIAVQAASALQALDAHELVHRDLKPSNMLLTSDSLGGVHLKLIDFGVAKEGISQDTGGLTDGGFIGTPAYASPEQLLESVHLDSRSDLYSLGAVMWFCLTGRPPFVGSQFEVMFDHLNTEPPWDELPSMPYAGLGLIKRLLAKSAEERHASPAALFQALQGLLGGTVGGMSLNIRGSGLDISKKEAGGYDLLEERTSDAFGKVWRARDILTHRTVALRLLTPEFSFKQGILLRVQRLVGFVRTLNHPWWQRVWHFEQSGGECRLATELVEGPTVLTLLKARQQLSLKEALPFLIQVAEAMDYAGGAGLTAMETAPERLPFTVEGWTSMPESEQNALLRQPFEQWPEWSVKLCPLRLSHSAQDYVLPTDTQAAQAIGRLSTDFVQLCYLVLTGQVRAAGGYTPSPSLSPRANDFFENHFKGTRQQRQTCAQLLQQICLASGVTPPPELRLEDHAENDGADPYATRFVTKTGHRPSPAPPFRSASPVLEEEDTTLLTSRQLSSLMSSDTFMEAVGIGRGAFPRRDDDTEADLSLSPESPKVNERVQGEYERIEREKAALEKARLEVAEQEKGRARAHAEEQHRLEEQKRALDQQQLLLEEKRREQQRLEQEIELRARLDFQKLQEEARARESDLQRQRAAMEQALLSREADFKARERESLDRLEALRQEALRLEEDVQQEYVTVRHIEAEQSRRQQDEQLAGEIIREKIAAEERRLEDLRGELSTRLGEWQGARRKKRLTLGGIIVGGLLVGGVLTWFTLGSALVGLLDFRELPGEKQWKASLTERDAALANQQWAEVLNWTVRTEEELGSKPEFKPLLQRHRDDLHAQAQDAVDELLSTGKFPPPSTETARQLVRNLDKVQGRVKEESRVLLMAKLRMKEAAFAGQPAESLELYQKAVQTNPGAAAKLQGELQATVDVLRSRMEGGALSITPALLEQVDGVARQAPESARDSLGLLRASMQVYDAMQEGRLENALKLLLEAVKEKPSWQEKLRPQAVVLMASLLKLEASRLKPMLASVRIMAQSWKLPEAYITLAALETNKGIQFNDYRQAEALGSLKAKAMLGRLQLSTGVAQQDKAMVEEGMGRLREAAATGDAEGTLLLADALYSGTGVKEDLGKAMELAQQARTRGHREAFFLEGKIWLKLGETAMDKGDESTAVQHYRRAATPLQRAMDMNLAGAPYYLYLASYEGPAKDRPTAAAALEKGAAEQDPRCLYLLGLWSNVGERPVPMNKTRSRELMRQAAGLGYTRAVEWLRANPR